MKRKLCALAVAFTLTLFFANGFAKQDGDKLKNLQYTGEGFLRYWNYDTPPCDGVGDPPYPPNLGCATVDGDSIRKYEFELDISIRGTNVNGYIDIWKGRYGPCVPPSGYDPAHWGSFPIENGRVEGNAISFTVVAELDPGEYSLFAFYLAEDDSDLGELGLGEFNGGEDLIGGAAKPPGKELVYVKFIPIIN